MFEKVAAEMQEPFPVLIQLEIYVVVLDIEAVIHSGFLGGSAPCLQRVALSGIQLREFPTFLHSSRDLVSLRFDIPATSHISPESMAAGLSGLARLKTLHTIFQFPDFPHEPRTRHHDTPLRA